MKFMTDKHMIMWYISSCRCNSLINRLVKSRFRIGKQIHIEPYIYKERIISLGAHLNNNSYLPHQNGRCQNQPSRHSCSSVSSHKHWDKLVSHQDQNDPTSFWGANKNVLMIWSSDGGAWLISILSLIVMTFSFYYAK